MNPTQPTARPTTSEIEAILVSMLATADAAGESFLDVTAKGLYKSVMGPTESSQGMAACCRLMQRMMIPGDHELTDSHSRNTGKLLIRFRVPR